MPEAANILFFNTDITSDPHEAAALRSRRFGRPAVGNRRTNSNFSRRDLPRVARRPIIVFTRSMSGDRWRAGLESDADRLQMDETGVGGPVQECHGFGQLQ
jgi:hypothetical protein